MKGSELFKKNIKQHLDKMAAEDGAFSAKYNNPDKSINKCIDYILGQVSKSGINGWTDDEIYGMAVHYFEETNVEILNSQVSDIVSNQLTGAEKEAAKRAAREQYQEIELERLEKKKEKKIKVNQDIREDLQLSLF